MKEKIKELKRRRESLREAFSIIDNVIKTYEVNPDNPSAIKAVDLIISN